MSDKDLTCSNNCKYGGLDKEQEPCKNCLNEKTTVSYNEKGEPIIKFFNYERKKEQIEQFNFIPGISNE